jgi:hypothetical protein
VGHREIGSLCAVRQGSFGIVCRPSGMAVLFERYVCFRSPLAPARQSWLWEGTEACREVFMLQLWAVGLALVSFGCSWNMSVPFHM